MTVQFASFSLPAYPGSPEEEELNRFLRSHTVLQCQTSFSPDAGGHWVVLVHFGMGKPGAGTGASGNRKVGKIDYREILSAQDFDLFDRLRRLRKQRAETDGVPVYAICTNEQLSKLATGRPHDTTGFRAIEGLGDAKTEKYAEAFLDVIRQAPPSFVPDVENG